MMNEFLRILKGDFGIFCVGLHLVNEMNYCQFLRSKQES